LAVHSNEVLNKVLFQMSIPYYQVDTFTNRLFAGNPAGVCFLAQWLEDSLLQRIASENNLAETAFVVQRQSSFDLRWFTPAMEVDLCGHATLAPAHVIFHHLGYQGSLIRFQTKAGELTVTRKADLLELDFPTRPPTECPLPTILEQALGIVPSFVGKSRDYLVLFDSEMLVREIQPDLTALMQLDSLGLIVTAPGSDCDFVSRFFAPRAGVPEDPVTGSAHSTLIPFWAQRLGKTRLYAKQISPRGGELFCEDRGQRVGIAGRAVTYSMGYLQVTAQYP
jgi:PhzF family phenazine biosynthesis protein